MPNEIKEKFGGTTALTITLASLANGSGRQSTIVANTTAKYADLIVYVKLTMSGSSAPNANAICEVYLIRGDQDATTEHLDDAAGASDAAITPLNAQLIGTLRTKGSPATSDVLQGSFLVNRPGPSWGIAIVNKSGQALHSTAGNHWVRYVGMNPEVQ